MQYTENYQFRKPVIGIDVADVKDINFNSDRADTLIHNTQISLAPAYDLNETYDTGDVVMYETLMYKCKADNTTGAWDASKWERTTAGEEGAGGGGGSSVVPNPQGSPTDTLETIEIDGTVYDIAGSGGGGGSAYKETTLWSGSNSASMTLSESFENYDAITVIATAITAQGNYRLTNTWPVEYLKQHINDGIRFGLTGDSWYVYFSITNNTTFTRQDQNTVYISDIIGLKLGGSGGSAIKDILYSDSNGAPHQTDVALAHNIFDYDEVYFKVSNPTDIAAFNAYTQQVFMPMMYNVGERWGIQALYDQRVVEITFPSDGLSFRIVRTAGDYSNNTVYEVIGIKH